MSKILVITYKNNKVDAKSEIKKAFSYIAPQNIDSNIVVYQSTTLSNTYIGVLNPEFEVNSKTEHIVSGFTRDIKGATNVLEDGAYFKIQIKSDSISFNVDRFESKSLWYYHDEEKFILTNSQLLITALKKSFNINKKTISWFLSSGSTGFQNAWDIETKKVLHSNQYSFSLKDWLVSKTPTKYAVENIKFSNKREFLQKYACFTEQVFKKQAKTTSVDKMVLPLSGGNDSRLLFYISNKLREYKNLTLANWGIKNSEDTFDDKKAANKIAKAYNKTLKDFYLPREIRNLDSFFDVFIKNGDCRIDHFNAYTDSFKIFEQLQDENYKYIIRGDIPFTEGLDLNDKMSRAHIGIQKFKDYGNCNSYILDDYIQIQEEDVVPITRKKNESLIEWRDRLYIDFRIPIVISSFDDLINSFIVTLAPMMSYSHYLLYCELKPNQRGDKAHIVNLSKQMDKSKVGFNASSSILGMGELLNTEKHINYLKKYLTRMDNNIFSKEMIESVNKQLSYSPLYNKSFKYKFINFIKENLPPKLKMYIKAKYTNNISSLTLAYRMVMVDKLYKIFNQATL
ncbi:hypothetical protein [Aequorivita sinensis]|uniref:hypothetical protein n=1 Tax=Aequorivita sinensis TaxID=1382458 RepID=UPI00111E0623|nr:hypothetical protein [Aequorivita sinensis]